jgi:hypothetical protein
MLSKESRKEIIRECKERKSIIGVYAVRCTANGRTWVGASRNLEATKNGCWFCLRNGSHREKSLQQEWNASGEAAFQYEILGRLDEDIHPLGIDDSLKDMKGDWIVRLNAQQLL